MKTRILQSFSANLPLVLVFMLLSGSTLLWSLKNAAPPAWDPADHISAAYDYYSPLSRGDLAGFAEEFFIAPSYYAPAVHLVTAAIFLLVGASKTAGIVVNLVSLAVLLASMVWLARLLYGGASGDTRLMGWTAGTLAAGYHFSAWLMHDAFLDFPLMAITALAFACLARAGDFADRGAAIRFGVAAGAGLLTKQTFAFFLVLPALYVAGRVLWNRDRRAILNLLLAGVIALALAAVWYAPHFQEVIAIYRVNRQAAINENEAPLWTLGSNLYYLHALLSTQMQLPLGTAFLAGLIWSLVRRRRESLLLYLWLASGLLIFTFIANKDTRYTVPVLPAAALLTVSWMAPGGPFEKRGRALKPALAAALGAWALVSFFNAQWPADGQGTYINTPRFRWMVFGRNYFGFDHRPTAEDWAIPEIVRFVAAQPAEWGVAPLSAFGDSVARQTVSEQVVSPQTRELKGGEAAPRPLLGVVVNLPSLNPSSVALEARLQAREPGGPPVIDVDWLVDESVRQRLGDCQYLLMRTGLDRAEWVAPIERYAEQLVRDNPGRYRRVAAFAIPMEGAEAVIYKCGGGLTER